VFSLWETIVKLLRGSKRLSVFHEGLPDRSSQFRAGGGGRVCLTISGIKGAAAVGSDRVPDGSRKQYRQDVSKDRGEKIDLYRRKGKEKLTWGGVQSGKEGMTKPVTKRIGTGKTRSAWGEA